MPVSSIVAFAILATTALALPAQDSRTVAAEPRPSREERIVQVRAELERIRKEMGSLEDQSRRLVDELRYLERKQAGVKPRWFGPNNVRDRARPWIEGALQLDDPARKTAALDAIRGALSGGDPEAAHSALVALRETAEAVYEKAPFRALVLPWTEHSDPALRCEAYYALHYTAREPADLARVLREVDDPRRAIRDSIVHLIILYSDNDLRGDAATAVLRLLDEDDRDVLHQRLPSLWGARVSPAITERLMELARSPDGPLRHDAVYFGLSTLRDKDEVVVDHLIVLLGDRSESERALWGLSHGVPEAQHSKVASALLRFVSARESVRMREFALECVGDYGSEEHLAALDGIAANELAPIRIRDAARTAAASVRSR